MQGHGFQWFLSFLCWVTTTEREAVRRNECDSRVSRCQCLRLHLRASTRGREGLVSVRGRIAAQRVDVPVPSAMEDIVVPENEDNNPGLRISLKIDKWVSK